MPVSASGLGDATGARSEPPCQDMRGTTTHILRSALPLKTPAMLMDMAWDLPVCDPI
jgi:hypothetical protein